MQEQTMAKTGVQRVESGLVVGRAIVTDDIGAQLHL
jgi:hypothetical protein